VAWARAYNRWLVETILSQEPRISRCYTCRSTIPSRPTRMVKDFGGQARRHRLHGDLGALHKPVYDNAYMKTYALLEELGLPLSFHAGLQLGPTQAISVSTASSRRMRWASPSSTSSISPTGS